MSDYLTRLRARRTALQQRALAAPAGVLPVVCVRCGATAERPTSAGLAAHARCEACGLMAAWEPVTDVIAALDRAIAWARSAEVVS